MATVLVKCPECLNELSARAVTCPRCGRPKMELPVWTWYAVALPAFLVLLSTILGDPTVLHGILGWLAWVAMWCALGVASVIHRWNSRV